MKPEGLLLCPPLVPIPSHMNPIQILPSHLLKHLFNIILFSKFWSSKSICSFSCQHFVCSSLPCMPRDENLKVITPWNVNVIERICKNSYPTSPKTQTAPTDKICLFSVKGETYFSFWESYGIRKYTVRAKYSRCISRVEITAVP